MGTGEVIRYWFDHVGALIKDTEETAEWFSSLFGFRVTNRQESQTQGPKTTLISKEKVTIGLMEPMGAERRIQEPVYGG